jgi:hypothetical protein
MEPYDAASSLLNKTHKHAHNLIHPGRLKTGVPAGYRPFNSENPSAPNPFQGLCTRLPAFSLSFFLPFDPKNLPIIQNGKNLFLIDKHLKR